MAKKKNNLVRNMLLIVGSLSLGLFVITLFAMTWSFLIENAMTVLAITGGIITIFTFVGILTYKRVKKNFKRAINRYRR